MIKTFDSYIGHLGQSSGLSKVEPPISNQMVYPQALIFKEKQDVSFVFLGVYVLVLC